eukprot:scaffold620166_cov39-Prasinocladus_malaysianus.AAC.1
MESEVRGEVWPHIHRVCDRKDCTSDARDPSGQVLSRALQQTLICASVGSTIYIHGSLGPTRACRYENAPHVELTNAAAEQMKITELRFGKTWGGAADSATETVERRTGTVLGQLAAQPAAAGGASL